MQAQSASLIRFAYGMVIDEFTGIPFSQSGSGARIKEPEPVNNSEDLVNKADDLLQAIPNPAMNDVVISYKLPVNNLSGKLRIMDVTGRLLYSTDVITSLNKLYVNTKEWAAGVYYYSLLVNNAIVNTKKLILTK
jgi:hypothetical protein